MKITVVKHVRQEQEIDVDLPYYFESDESDNDGSQMIYGMMDKGRNVFIRIKRPYSIDNDSREISITELFPYGATQYLNGDYCSTKDDFNQALDEMLSAISWLRGKG